MSVTPGLGSFNKDKVANKFGIQLKTKDGSKQAARPANEPPATVSKNKTVSDFRRPTLSNGSAADAKSAAPSSTRTSTNSSFQNSVKSKSSIGLVSTGTVEERRKSLTSNENHSTPSKPVKPSTSSSNLSSLPLSPETINQTALARSPSPVRRPSVAAQPPSAVRRTSVTSIAPEPTPVSKPADLLPVPAKTEAEIEHQKDQPLYKRQLTKTIDNATAAGQKGKHPHELANASNASAKG